LKKSEKKFSGTCAVAKVMYRADEAWRKELRGATLEDLLKSVMADVPMEQLQRGWDWLRTK
jgi:DNA-binding IscR family transcriptional regulator